MSHVNVDVFKKRGNIQHPGNYTICGHQGAAIRTQETPRTSLRWYELPLSPACTEW